MNSLISSDTHTGSSDNTPDSELKSALARQITHLLKCENYTQREAAAVLGIPQPKVSCLRNGKLNGFSLMKLISLVAKLGHDTEISFKKSEPGHEPSYFIRTQDGRYRIRKN
jgi:predicted XRE-type DNA-binding protein